MSSESSSEISESEMIEGSTVNVVLESQVDPSISQSLHQASSTSVLGLELKPEFKSPVAENQLGKRPKSLMRKLKELTTPGKSSLPNLKCSDKVYSKRALRKLPNVNRFYSFKKEIQDKLEMNREIQRREEEKQCTFKPLIHSDKRKRSFKEVYADIIKHQRHRDQKIEELKEIKQQQETICHFRPSICNKSKQIMRTKSWISEKCHDRLYRLSRKPRFGESIAEELSKCSELDPFSSQFIPRVSRLSRSIKNKQPITERLYDDAIRRRSIPTLASDMDSIHTSLSNNSMRILIDTFISEFSKQTNRLDPKRTGKVNYCKFIALFKHLHFLNEHSKTYNDDIVALIGLWRTICDKEFVELADLKVLMIGIMGYYLPWMNDPKQQSFLLSREGVRNIHESYLRLFENRCSFSLKTTPKNAKSSGRKIRRNICGALKRES